MLQLDASSRNAAEVLRKLQHPPLWQSPTHLPASGLPQQPAAVVSAQWQWQMLLCLLPSSRHKVEVVNAGFFHGFRNEGGEARSSP